MIPFLLNSTHATPGNERSSLNESAKSTERVDSPPSTLAVDQRSGYLSGVGGSGGGVIFRKSFIG